MKNKKKDLDYYMSLHYPVTLDVQEESGKPFFDLQIPDLPGVWGRGDTLDDAYRDLSDSKKMWFDIRLQEGMDIPEPISEDDFSGKFVLRLDPQAHMSLTKEAKRKNVSLNQLIKAILDERASESKTDSEIAKFKEIVLNQSQQLNELKTAIIELSNRISQSSMRVDAPTDLPVVIMNNDLGGWGQQYSFILCEEKENIPQHKKPLIFTTNLFGKHGHK